MNILPKHSKDAREMLSLSQSVVARGAEINRSYLSQWENETKILPDSTLVRLHDYYESMGYEFPEVADIGQEPAQAAPAAPVVSPASGPALPGNTYLVDGHLIPKAIRPGVVENILEEIHAGEILVAEYLADTTEIEPVVTEDGFFFEGEIDHTPVENQRAAALAVMAVLAKNYLLLKQLRGDDEFNLVEIASGEDHSPEYLKTNAGAIAQALSHAPADFERLNAAV